MSRPFLPSLSSLFPPVPYLTRALPYLRSRTAEIQLGVCERCELLSSSSGVWPAEIEFGAFSLRILHLVATIVKYFPENQLAKIA